MIVWSVVARSVDGVEMASRPEGGEAPAPLSLRHGVRCEVESSVAVEEVLLSIGEQVGYENISSASRMNKAVVVFLKEENLVNRLVSSGISVSGVFVTISPLVNPTQKVIISNVPPFIPDDEIERALLWYGKFASPLKTIPLGCKNTSLKHVMSFRRQVAMFLKQPDLDVSFRVSYEGKTYMIYASTGSLKCFECGNVGHKRATCPHKAGSSANSAPNPTANESSTEQTAPNVNLIVDSEARDDSNGEQMAPNVNFTVDSEARNESNGGQTTLNERKESGGNDGASCSSVGQEKKIFEKTVETEGSLGSKTCKDSEVQMNELVNVEINKELSPEMVREEEIRDDDMLSDISEIGSQNMEDMYSLDEINDFLDTTFGKVVEVKDFFPDVEKFVVSVKVLQRTVSYDALSKQKRFRLKKLVTKLRKNKGPSIFKK